MNKVRKIELRKDYKHYFAYNESTQLIYHLSFKLNSDYRIRYYKIKRDREYWLDSSHDLKSFDECFLRKGYEYWNEKGE